LPRLRLPVQDFGMAERVINVDPGVTWDPGYGGELLQCADDGTARLAIPGYGTDSHVRCVVLTWDQALAFTAGWPNDEAIAGHRLWSMGLADVDLVGEVLDSQWVADLELRNRVHPNHRPARFAALHHFIVPLKEVTAEVVAPAMAVARVRAADPVKALAKPAHT